MNDFIDYGVPLCKFCKSNKLKNEVDGIRCMSCGVVSNEPVFEHQTEFTNNGRPQNHIQKMEDLQHVKLHVQHLHQIIYGGMKNDSSAWVTVVTDIYKKLLTARSKSLKGMKTIIIVTVIIECMLMSEKRPLVRPLLLQFLNTTLNAYDVKSKSKAVTMSQYENYRAGKKGLRTILERIQPTCYGKRKPPVDQYIAFTANILKARGQFKEENKLKATKFAKLLDDNKSKLGIDMYTNSEIAVCVLFLFSNFLDTKLKQREKIFGISSTRIQNLYKKIHTSTVSVVQDAITKYELKHPDEWFRKSSPKKKGPKRKESPKVKSPKRKESSSASGRKKI